MVLTLNAYRKKITFGIYKGLTKTVLKNHKGVIKLVIPPYKKQPKDNHKKITINQINYNLKFI